MLYKTRGIVINYIKFRETSIIAKIYTERFGMQSYIINGIRSKKGSKIALYQPLTLLELVVYHKHNAQLFRISETKCAEPLTLIPVDFKRSCIAMFVTEILNKTLKGEAEPQLYEFVHSSVLFLDHIEENFENFHLQFLLKLSKYLGFAPETEDQILEQVGYIPLDQGAVNEQNMLKDLLLADYKNNIKVNNNSRRKLLEVLLKYYSLHLENLGEINSVTVLKEVMS